ncbi:MAG: hypothetical protein Q8N85_03080, partial [Candidatus Omnitrophota bacterium]|nr:hypothetical protein [Candidatus Omnitrophota bacterium]
MPRVQFLECKQSEFLNKVNEKYDLDWPKVAKICRVHRRTLFDWRRDKYQMGEDSFQFLRKRLHFSVPKVKFIADDWNIGNAA